MMVMDGASKEAAFSVAVVALILAVYNQALPDHRSVAAQPADAAVVRETREHMFMAGGFSLAMGVAAGAMVKSAWPMVAAVLTVGYLSMTYNRAAKRNPA